MSTTYETHDLLTAWTRWHADREADLAAEHGWLSLTGFHWLPPAPAALDGLPGRWHTGARSRCQGQSGGPWHVEHRVIGPRVPSPRQPVQGRRCGR